MDGFINTYNDIANYVVTAVGEIAYDPFALEDYKDKVTEGKKRGVRDVRGWLADELYNDADLVNDLVGDQLYSLISSKYGEDPTDKEVWAKHLAEMNKHLPHVTLS